jgi:5-methylthioadenosine/S-adenosylhomocysteine deaminase
MTLFRGVEDDIPLKEWLFDRIFPLEARFVDEKFVRLGTQLAAWECIRFGTTTIADMYFYPEVAMKVWDKVGLRGVFGQPFMSIPTPEDHSAGDSAVQRFERLFEKVKAHSRLSISLAPHAPYTCTDELLLKIIEVQKQTGVLVQIHVSETQAEVEESAQKFGKSPVKRLYDLGLLGPKTLIAHAVHLLPGDLELLRKTQTKIAHNPDSNCKLASGVAPVRDYLDQGLVVSLGTDGAASNNSLSLFGAMNLMAKLHKVTQKDSMKMQAYEVLYAATMGGAKALNLERQIGSLEEGKWADIIIVDGSAPNLTPLTDPISHLVYSATGYEVDTVFCHGKLLMKNKKIKTINKNQIVKKANALRNRIYEHLQLKNQNSSNISPF